MNSKYPNPPITEGRRGALVRPDGTRRRFTIKGEIRRVQSNAPHKVIYLQRVAFEDGVEELRLAYYIIGKKPKMAGRWVFGQYATLMPVEDFRAIIQEAHRRGWL